MAAAALARLMSLVLFLSSMVLLLANTGIAINVTEGGGKMASLFFQLTGSVYPDGLFGATLNIVDEQNSLKEHRVHIDTGSTLTWLSRPNCDEKGDCAKVYNPYQLVESKIIPCHNPACVAVRSDIGLSPYKCGDGGCPGRCCYEIKYLDQSKSEGVVVNDNFSLRQTSGANVRTPLIFGAGYNHLPNTLKNDKMSLVDGLMGLSKGRTTVVSQLKQKGLISGNVIGHCLGRKRGGYMFFGNGCIPSAGMTWVEMPREHEYYQLDKVTVNFQDRLMGKTKQTVVFDSGSTFTHFSRQTYQAFLAALKESLIAHKGQLVLMTGGDNHVCWMRVGGRRFAKLNEVENYFKGSIEIIIGAQKMTISYQNYLYLNNGYVCLGIRSLDQDFNIIGDVSMLDRLVIYDNEKSLIGWTASDCDEYPPNSRACPSLL